MHPDILFSINTLLLAMVPLIAALTAYLMRKP